MKWNILLFCALAGLVRAEGYLDVAAVFSKLSAPAINGDDRANGAGLEGGWKFGTAKQHALTIGLGAVQGSGARESFMALYGTSVSTRSVRTRLETLLVGYSWETPLGGDWRLRLAAGAGFGRIRDTTETVLIYSGNPTPQVTRRSGSESAKACGRLGADLRWHFSRRGHVLLGAEWLRKAADDGFNLPHANFGAVTAVSGRVGIGFRF
jgi:hypothetical protein